MFRFLILIIINSTVILKGSNIFLHVLQVCSLVFKLSYDLAETNCFVLTSLNNKVVDFADLFAFYISDHMSHSCFISIFLFSFY